MDNEFISNFTSYQVDQGIDISLKVIKLISLITFHGYDASNVDSLEWSYLILDSQDKIIAGIKLDGSIFIGDI